MQELLNNEEVKLWQRREQLKLLLVTEEEQLLEELRRKQENLECGYCKEKKGRIKEHLQEIENEKLRECLKGLEREKMWVILFDIVQN